MKRWIRITLTALTAMVDITAIAGGVLRRDRVVAL